VNVFCCLCIASLISLYQSDSNVQHGNLNHRKPWNLPKIDSKQGYYLPLEANGISFDHWLWFDIWKTAKLSTNIHTWYSMYFYQSLSFCEVICQFLFVTVSFWTDQDMRWPSFTIDVAVHVYVFGGILSLHHIGEQDIDLNNCLSGAFTCSNHFGQWHCQNALPILNQNIVYCKLCFGLMYIYSNHLKSKMMLNNILVRLMIIVFFSTCTQTLFSGWQENFIIFLLPQTSAQGP